MKNNQDFIKGIYEKYDKYTKETKEKEFNKNKSSLKILGMVASFAIIFSLLLFGYENSKILERNNPSSQEVNNYKTLDLATVDNFNNFYNILKNMQNYSNYDRIDMAQNEAKNEAIDQDVSDTNVQVQNVDEGDIVKTDGKNIYSISENRVIITDVTNPKEMKNISIIDFKEENIVPQELYINQNRLIILGQKYNNTVQTKIIDTLSVDMDSATMISKNKTVMIIYGLENQLEPKEVRRIEIEGDYLSSRMIQENIYFVVNKNIYINNIINKDITTLNEEDFKPKFRDSLKSEEVSIPYEDIAYFENPDEANYLILAGININKSDSPDIKTFLGAGEMIYCSENSMYILKNIIQFDNQTKQVYDNKSKILKFSLSDGKINYQAETEVDGYINNQFSADERNGYFKIATTIGNRVVTTTPQTSNTLYIFDEDLKEVAKIENLAIGEKIYSVRYTDKLAYIVTFKEVDPLFVIDISDPKSPKVVGELKVPGYSTYLHPYDDIHLIGFGYDVSENGNRTSGLKMTMFDISDINNPKEMYTQKIGNSNTNSELTYNHKALYFSKERNLIGFPVTTYNKNIKYKAQIYNIDLNSGFILKGEIEHTSETPSEIQEYKNEIDRVLNIGNVIYSVSENQIRATDINTMTQIGIIYYPGL